MDNYGYPYKPFRPCQGGLVRDLSANSSNIAFEVSLASKWWWWQSGLKWSAQFDYCFHHRRHITQCTYPRVAIFVHQHRPFLQFCTIVKHFQEVVKTVRHNEHVFVIEASGRLIQFLWATISNLNTGLPCKTWISSFVFELGYCNASIANYGNATGHSQLQKVWRQASLSLV